MMLWLITDVCQGQVIGPGLRRQLPPWGSQLDEVQALISASDFPLTPSWTCRDPDQAQSRAGRSERQGSSGSVL